MAPSTKRPGEIDKSDRRRPPIVLRTLPGPSLSFSTPTHSVSVQLSFRAPAPLKPFDDMAQPQLASNVVLSDIIRGANSPHPPDRASISSGSAESEASSASSVPPSMHQRVVDMEYDVKRLKADMQSVQGSVARFWDKFEDVGKRIGGVEDSVKQLRADVNRLPSFHNIRGAVLQAKNELTANMDSRFQQVDERIDGLDKKFDGRFQQLDERIDGLDKKFGGRFQQVDERIDGLDKKFDGRFQQVNERIDGLTENVNALNSRMSAMEQILARILDAVTVVPPTPQLPQLSLGDLLPAAPTSPALSPVTPSSPAQPASASASTTHLTVPYPPHGSASRSTPTLGSRSSLRRLRSTVLSLFQQGRDINDRGMRLAQQIPTVVLVPEQGQGQEQEQDQEQEREQEEQPVAGPSSSQGNRHRLGEPIVRPEHR